jgi:hypothetical protein
MCANWRYQPSENHQALAPYLVWICGLPSSCSSCCRRTSGRGRTVHLARVPILPPAAAYLKELSRDRGDVLPLAFHVTYWDRLGWKDPFSLEAATERQDRYGHRFGDGSYTPEIVVDGASSHVGSHRQAVGSAIERAKQESRTVATINVVKDDRASFIVAPVGRVARKDDERGPHSQSSVRP